MEALWILVGTYVVGFFIALRASLLAAKDKWQREWAAFKVANQHDRYSRTAQFPPNKHNSVVPPVFTALGWPGVLSYLAIKKLLFPTGFKTKFDKEEAEARLRAEQAAEYARAKEELRKAGIKISDN